jgi:hypothetical protein
LVTKFYTSLDSYSFAWSGQPPVDVAPCRDMNRLEPLCSSKEEHSLIILKKNVCPHPGHVLLFEPDGWGPQWTGGPHAAVGPQIPNSCPHRLPQHRGRQAGRPAGQTPVLGRSLRLNDQTWFMRVQQVT